ncbi:hypothetical protein ACIBEA_41770 [Streptomyces sp. NPDC051555]|uniref:hypothetical protein n=1 Tax=Streptomyces sp. NPDC051555 TaxID=3365657 RepID=UPI003788222B
MKSPNIEPRTVVLGILGAITAGVAALSISVSYGILVPHFGAWATPTVVTLDALWVVLQATEIVAGADRSRARRVRAAGVVLTLAIAAIPTVELIETLHRAGAELDLAVVLTPAAIGATKLAWWVVLPSLGRRTSARTRQTIAARRQTVADRLEQMQADAADRIELYRVGADLNRRVAEAEADYRRGVLTAQQTTVEQLHTQAEATAQTLADMPLPPLATDIVMPALDGWTPSAPALPVAPVTPAVTPVTPLVTQVSALPTPAPVTPVASLTLPELAAVAGVTVPVEDVPLTDAQLLVVLRHLRYRTDPPSSYRAASSAFWRLGYQGSARRVRKGWAALVELDPGHSSDADDVDTEESSEDEGLVTYPGDDGWPPA